MQGAALHELYYASSRQSFADVGAPKLQARLDARLHVRHYRLAAYLRLALPKPLHVGRFKETTIGVTLDRRFLPWHWPA